MLITRFRSEVFFSLLIHGAPFVSLVPRSSPRPIPTGPQTYLVASSAPSSLVRCSKTCADYAKSPVQKSGTSVQVSFLHPSGLKFDIYLPDGMGFDIEVFRHPR